MLLFSKLNFGNGPQLMYICIYLFILFYIVRRSTGKKDASVPIAVSTYIYLVQPMNLSAHSRRILRTTSEQKYKLNQKIMASPAIPHETIRKN